MFGRIKKAASRLWSGLLRLYKGMLRQREQGLSLRARKDGDGDRRRPTFNATLIVRPRAPEQTRKVSIEP